MSSVCFLMLDPTHLPWDVNKEYLCRKHGVSEVWSLNDYYVFFPELKPDKVFQIHKDFKGHKEKSRFTGNYLRKYNEDGATIITTSHYPELEREELLPMDEWEEQWGNQLNCTLSFMFIYALNKGYTKIVLDGTNACLGPYAWEIPIILDWIDQCRLLDVEFKCHMEKKWRAIRSMCNADDDPLVYWKRP